MRLLSIVLFFAISISFGSVSAQDCRIYFPDEEGTLREMTNYDKKDKVTGKTLQKILEKKVEGNNVHLVVETRVVDDKDQPLSQTSMELTCDDGVFKVDMSEYLTGVLAAYQSMEIEMDGDQLVFPSKMNVGDELPDASMQITVSSNGISMINMNVEISNRKVIARETLSTPAGSFDCYKLSYDLLSKTRLVNVTTSSVEWVSEGAGVVKTESYNKNGKLMGYSLLTRLD